LLVGIAVLAYCCIARRRAKVSTPPSVAMSTKTARTNEYGNVSALSAPTAHNASASTASKASTPTYAALPTLSSTYDALPNAAFVDTPTYNDVPIIYDETMPSVADDGTDRERA
jgi:hypothetical protein